MRNKKYKIIEGKKFTLWGLLTAGSRKQESSSGFTLVEMFIVISIFAVMGSIVLFKFKNYTKSASLDNLAQDVALRIVGTQKTAISGVLLTAGTGDTPPVYGISFNSSATGLANNKNIIYYTDINLDSLFNITSPGTTTRCGLSYGAECLSVTGITTGDYISKICTTSGTTGNCTSTTSSGSVNITYKRPFPDAHIRASFGTYVGTDAPRVYIELSSADGLIKRTIIATSLGQTKVFNGSVTGACSADGVTSGC